MKTILNDIKLVIEYNLRYSKSHLIYRSVCFAIIETIEKHSKTYSNKGYEITLNQFSTSCNVSVPVINRHIKWLMEQTIIWRSNLSYKKTDVKMDQYDIYRYDIHSAMPITTLKRFIYKTANTVDTIDIEPTEKALNIMYKSLKRMSIDIESALNELYESDIDNKFQQSRALYKVYLNNHTINYGTNVNRVYHTITSISSFLHKYLYIDGYKVSEIDAKQSQLTLISNITHHIDSDFHSIIADGSFYDWLINHLKETVTEVTTNVSIGGRVWKAKVAIEDINEKADIKPMVYASIFSGFKNGTTVSKVMKSYFNDVIIELNNIVGEESLASYLQNLEASIWVNASVELNENGILNVTKHDSILYNGLHKSLVLKCVKKHYNKRGIKYSVKFNHSPVTNNVFPYQQDSPVINEVVNDLDNLHQSNTDMTLYTFEHKDGRVFTGIKSEFVKQYQLDKKSVRGVIIGIRKSVGGWFLGSSF